MWLTVKMTDGFTGGKMQVDKVFMLSVESFLCLLRIEGEEKLYKIGLKDEFLV